MALFTGMTAAATPHYRRMAIEDFIVDGPQLVKHHTPVELHGVFSHETNLMYDWFSTAEPEKDGVFLLLDDASHDLRQLLYECGAGFCAIRVTGEATMCVLTNQFGASHSEPCVAVRGGDANVRPYD